MISHKKDPSEVVRISLGSSCPLHGGYRLLILAKRLIARPTKKPDQIINLRP
jgi:hypothetical protein